jgi:hypothetical protein
MAKINAGTITADGAGNWTSDSIDMGSAGSKTVYMRVNGTEVLTRNFTVAAGGQTIAQDGSTLTANSGWATTINTGATLSTAGTNRLIVAAFTVGGNTQPTGITISGGGLTWHEGVYRTQATGAVDYNGVWWAWASSQLTNQTITAAWTVNNLALLSVVALSGSRDHDGLSAGTDFRTNTATGTGTAMAISLNTIGATGSWIIGAGMNWGATTLTQGADTTNINTRVSGTPGLWTMMSDTAVDTGSHTLNETSNVSESWHCVAMEILAGA